VGGGLKKAATMVGMTDGLSRISTAVSSRGWLQVLLLLALVAALLSPAVRAGFLWDDFDQIVNSTTIGDPSRIPFYFTHNVVQSAGGEGRGADGVDTYRPLFMVALAAVYQINGPDPLWFHLAVLAAHLVVCLLLWCLGARWLGSQLATAVAVLFFACHPVTAEAYLWSSALPEPMAAAGLLGAILILDRRAGEDQRGPRIWVAAVTAALVFFAGLFAKEVVLAALPAFGLYLVLARGVRPRHLVPAVIAGFVFVVLRTAALSGLQATGADAVQRFAALKVYPVLVLDGLLAMLTMQPIGIRHLSWEYAALGWGASAAAAALCLALLVVAVALRRTAPLMLAAALTTGLMLLPIALVATVPGWGGFGRYLYLPLGITALALAELGLRAHRALALNNPRLWWAVPLIVVAALIVEQVGLRRALWVYANQENVARAAIEIFPDGPDGWEWLGNVHIEKGELEEARVCFQKATERGPELFRPRHNLAAALLYTGRPAEALEQLEMLDSLHPPTAPGSKVAVTALMELGRWNEAAARLVDSLDRDPGYEPLKEMATRLLSEHPRPDELRAWLSQELARPAHANAAKTIGPMLSTAN
jgi:tetratricopeptide (TPR) repeat protein